MAGGDDAGAVRGAARDDRTSESIGETDARAGLSRPDRRTLLQATCVAGVGASFLRAFPVIAAEPPKQSQTARPQEGDRFVFASGDKAGTEITPEDLAEGAPQILAWPLDPRSKAPRDGSRLNQVVLIRLDPASLDDATKSHSAGGIVAYSATCTHAQCPVAGWNSEKKVFHCQCHQSEYDPRQDGKVVFGPAPRALPALPIKIDGGALIAAGTFLGKVGQRPS